MKLPWSKSESPEEIRGMSNERLKFVPTQNLVLIAIARLMEANGVEDEVLIEELYLRGRANSPKFETKK